MEKKYGVSLKKLHYKAYRKASKMIEFSSVHLIFKVDTEEIDNLILPNSIVKCNENINVQSGLIRLEVADTEMDAYYLL